MQNIKIQAFEYVLFKLTQWYIKDNNIVDYNDNIVRIKMKHIYYNKKVVDSITRGSAMQ